VTTSAVTTVVNNLVTSGQLSSAEAAATISAVSSSVSNVVAAINSSYSGLGNALHAITDPNLSATDLAAAKALISQAQASAALSQTQLLNVVADVKTLAQSGASAATLTSAALDTTEVSADVSTHAANFQALLDVSLTSSTPSQPIYLLADALAMDASNKAFVGSQVLLTPAIGTATNPITLTQANVMAKHGLHLFHADNSAVSVTISSADWGNLTSAETSNLNSLISSIKTAGATSFELNNLTVSDANFTTLTSISGVSEHALGVTVTAVPANHASALLADGGVWMAMKGKKPVEELASLPADVEVFHVEQLQVPGLEAQRCLVWMRRRVAV
jgi:hypothetical protein